MNEFWSAIAGAVVGGVITALLQLQVSLRGKSERAADRLEARQAVAYSLIFKMGKIASGLENISRLVEAAVAIPPDGDLWQRVRSIANPPDRVVFSAEEMALVYWAESAFFNELVSIDDQYNTIVTIAEQYKGHRSALIDAFEPVDYAPDGSGLTLSDERQWGLRPKIDAAEGAIATIAERCRPDADRAMQLTVRLADILRERLKMPSLAVSPKRPISAR